MPELQPDVDLQQGDVAVAEAVPAEASAANVEEDVDDPYDEAIATSHPRRAYNAARSIAMAVLHRALLDASLPVARRVYDKWVDPLEARYFLQGGDGLAEWCEVAEMDMQVVTRYACRRWPRVGTRQRPRVAAGFRWPRRAKRNI